MRSSLTKVIKMRNKNSNAFIRSSKSTLERVVNSMEIAVRSA
jgi:hypothetical protein